MPTSSASVFSATRGPAMLLALTAWLVGTPLAAQRRPLIGSGTGHARGTLRAVSVGPARAVILVTLAVDPGWHVSWRNPGETGLPTRLAWRLPAGVRAVRETWPVPVIAHTDVGATHTLAGEIPWLVEFAVDGGSGADRPIQLTIRYGVCRNVCIPEQLIVRGVLPGGASVVPPPVTATLRARLAADGGTIAARRHGQSELCLERLPGSWSGSGIEMVADSGRNLDAALPVTKRAGVPAGPWLVRLPVGGVLRSAIDTVLLVQGTRGLSVPLDFRAPVRRCGGRRGPA